MTPTEWAAVVTCCIGVVAAVYSGVKVMVRSVMDEFKPNGGSSLKDQVNRIEARLDVLYNKLID
jgi:hypothetical protein